MQQTQTAKKEASINLFNARERYFQIRSKLKTYAALMDDIKDHRHPGVLDLATHLANLNMVHAQSASIFDSGDPKKITNKHLTMLNNFEMLVQEFEAVLREAHEELTKVK